MYAGARNAVALCESLHCWDVLRRTAETEGVTALKEYMRQCLRNALREAVTKGDAARQQMFQAALAELDHPNFGIYLVAKIGAL